MIVFTNSLLTVTSDYTNPMGRTLPTPHLDRQSVKTKYQPKKVSRKKKVLNQKRKIKQVDANQQAENLILNTKFSDDSNDFQDRHDIGSTNVNYSQPNNPNNDDTSSTSYYKNDAKQTNTPDILSMVLSLKKNALMHDPYVIQFISSIRYSPLESYLVS